MSIYTEIVIHCAIDTDISLSDLENIRAWLGLSNKEEMKPLPLYFDVFGETSHYRPGASQRSLVFETDQWYLTLRASIKNYDASIQIFLKQLAASSLDRGFVGYIRHEFEENPTLVFFLEGKVYLRQMSLYHDVEV